MKNEEDLIIDFLKSIESTLKYNSERLDKIMESMGLEKEKIDQTPESEEKEEKPLLTKESLDDLRDRLVRIKDALKFDQTP
jgi:hypothetical protein